MNPEITMADDERFWAKTAPDGECIVWTAGKFPAGYGAFFVGGRNHGAHRIAYELAVADIPEGVQLDHLCRNRACVNPDHLEPVTLVENLRRGRESSGTHEYANVCPRGHAYDEGNTYTDRSGRRHCRECSRTRTRAWRAAR